MKTIEFRDLKRQYEKYKDDFDKAISGVIESSSFIFGPPVARLEKELSEYVGVKHCFTCANGTDAMSLVLMAWGIKSGDAVFVPNYTFFSTAEVVTHIGATPVFVDVDSDTFNIDSRSLEQAIIEVKKNTNLTTRAIITVDLFGLCANYVEIEEIANKYSLLLLEDAAQGFGAELNGRKACSFGNAATSSFYPAKPLGCYGDGGAIFTNDDQLAIKIKSLRSHGIGQHRYDHIQVGLNSRLDTIQAAILLVKLEALRKHELQDVNRIARLYNQGLKEFVKLPLIPDGFYSSYAQFTIQLKNRIERDGLSRFLNDRSIPTVLYYPKTMHQQKVYEDHKMNVVSLDQSVHLTERALSLPMHPYLTDEEIHFIITNVKFFLTKDGDLI